MQDIIKGRDDAGGHSRRMMYNGGQCRRQG